MYFTLVCNRIKSEYFHYKQSIEAKNYETSFWQLSNNQSKNQFRIKISNKLPNISQRQPTSFSEYIKIQPLWIRELIQSYKHNTKEKSLFYRIGRQIPLIISTDGAKGDRRIGGSLIIAKQNKTHITSGYNPNFGQIRQTKSYRAEIYASLSVFLFLYYYAK